MRVKWTKDQYAMLNYREFHLSFQPCNIKRCLKKSKIDLINMDEKKKN